MTNISGEGGGGEGTTILIFKNMYEVYTYTHLHIVVGKALILTSFMPTSYGRQLPTFCLFFWEQLGSTCTSAASE
jgi:hypothetical protein